MQTYRVSRNDIIKQVPITGIASRFNLSLERVSSGNFQWRCRCPSKDHKHGMEKTSSLYINDKDNNFFCYGCNSGSSVIDFYMMCHDVDFQSAFSQLKSLVKEPGKFADEKAKIADNLPLLMDNSKIIREYLLEDPSRINSMDSFLKNLDSHLFDTHKDDLDFIKKTNKKLKDKLGI
jgi:DNA primase